jgi:hypothetical protein
MIIDDFNAGAVLHIICRARLHPDYWILLILSSYPFMCQAEKARMACGTLLRGGGAEAWSWGLISAC